MNEDKLYSKLRMARLQDRILRVIFVLFFLLFILGHFDFETCFNIILVITVMTMIIFGILIFKYDSAIPYGYESMLSDYESRE